MQASFLQENPSSGQVNVLRDGRGLKRKDAGVAGGEMPAPAIF